MFLSCTCSVAVMFILLSFSTCEPVWKVQTVLIQCETLPASCAFTDLLWRSAVVWDEGGNESCLLFSLFALLSWIKALKQELLCGLWTAPPAGDDQETRNRSSVWVSSLHYSNLKGVVTHFRCEQLHSFPLWFSHMVSFKELKPAEIKLSSSRRQKWKFVCRCSSSVFIERLVFWLCTSTFQRQTF